MVGGIPQSLSVLPVLDLVELGKIQVQVYSPPAARGTSLVGCRLVLCGQHQLDEMPREALNVALALALIRLDSDTANFSSTWV